MNEMNNQMLQSAVVDRDTLEQVSINLWRVESLLLSISAGFYNLHDPDSCLGAIELASETVSATRLSLDGVLYRHKDKNDC